MKKTKPTETVWWAGYMAGLATVMLGGEVKALATGMPACGDITCNHPWYTIPAALLALLWSCRMTRRAEKTVALHTWEDVEKPRHHSVPPAYNPKGYYEFRRK